jgi:hypothetical protein
MSAKSQKEVSAGLQPVCDYCNGVTTQLYRVGNDQVCESCLITDKALYDERMSMMVMHTLTPDDPTMGC